MIVKKKYSLSKLNTFGLSVIAENYAEAHDLDELKLILKSGFKPIHILGGGSNVLLTKNVKGLVLKNEIKGIDIIDETYEQAIVAVGGGELWHELVCWAIKNNLGGIENLSLIPGSVGAAPIQNIGAYGVELKDVFEKLEAVELTTGKLKVFDKNDCRFGYRDSVFKNKLKGKYFITKIFLKLNKKPHQLNTSYGAIKNILIEKNIENPTILDVSNAVINIRKSKLPDPQKIGNAGSFFKNPEIEMAHFIQLKKKFTDIPKYDLPNGKVKVPAGWLIEKAGWKGKRIGDTGVHKKQALVLVNYGNAKGEEIKKLAADIQESVKNRFNILLVKEVNIW